LGIATLGQDLFIGQAPSSNKVSNDLWWIVATGGSGSSLASGENLKVYTIEVYRRSRNYETVYADMQSLEQILNCDDCVQLEDFQTVDVKATVLSIDSDLDAEDRKVGLLQTNITVYDSC